MYVHPRAMMLMRPVCSSKGNDADEACVFIQGQWCWWGLWLLYSYCLLTEVHASQQLAQSHYINSKMAGSLSQGSWLRARHPNHPIHRHDTHRKETKYQCIVYSHIHAPVRCTDERVSSLPSACVLCRHSKVRWNITKSQTFELTKKIIEE